MRVKLADGREALTRDGNLHVDGEGRLVTSFGGLMSPTIQIPRGTPESKIAIGEDGTVLAAGRNVGRIQLVNVRSPQNLESVGDNAFVATARWATRSPRRRTRCSSRARSRPPTRTWRRP